MLQLTSQWFAMTSDHLSRPEPILDPRVARAMLAELPQLNVARIMKARKQHAFQRLQSRVSLVCNRTLHAAAHCWLSSTRCP